MNRLTKTIKELTGEDAVDMFGGDAENEEIIPRLLVAWKRYTAS